MLPREDVELVYMAVVNTPRTLVREDIYRLLPQFNVDEINWAVGTMAMQGILTVNPHVRSDRKPGSPSLTVGGPFLSYIGWEEAK